MPHLRKRHQWSSGALQTSSSYQYNIVAAAARDIIAKPLVHAYFAMKPYVPHMSGYKRHRSGSIVHASSAGANIHVGIAGTCTGGKTTTATLDGDAGNIQATGCGIKCIQDGLEYDIFPKGHPFSKTYTDKRPLLTQLALPSYQTYASNITYLVTATNPNQKCQLIVNMLAADEMMKIRDLVHAHGGGTAPGTALGPGGLAPQLEVPLGTNYINNSLELLKYHCKVTFRNPTNIECKFVIEEWLCRRDTATTNTPQQMYNDWLTWNEDNNTTIDTAVAAVQWRLDAAATCRVATLNDPGERMKGPSINRMFKKIKSTKISLASGRTVSYNMVEKPLRIPQVLLTEWEDNQVFYVAGITRAIYVYLIGETGGTTTAESTIAPTNAYLNYKQETFVAYCNNIANVKRRDITYITTQAGIYPTVAAAAQTTTNEETEAPETNVDQVH